MKWSGVQLGEGYECQDYRDEQVLALPAYVDPDDRGRYVWVYDTASPDYGLWAGDGVAGAWVKAGGGTIRTVARPWGNGIAGELRRDAVTGVVFIWNDTYAYWQPILYTETTIDYYVDPVAGVDTNTGANPASALATIMEAIWRLPPLVTQTVTIHLTGGAAGAPLTYDEALAINNFRFQGGEIVVIGASALAAPPTGPNQAVTTATTFNSITVLGAGWTPGVMVGLRVKWTSGVQSAVAPYAFIVDNTADTLFLSATAVAGVYGVGDGFDVEEITTILQNVSLPPCTLEMYNLFGAILSWGVNSWVTFQGVHVVGDGATNLAVNLSGSATVEFIASRIDDIATGAGSGTGLVFLDQCGIFLTANGATTPWFSSAPDWSGAINALFTGGIFTLLQESTSHRYTAFLWGAVYGDGVLLTELFIQRSGYLYLSLCRLFGNVGTATPILCDRGGGRVYIQDCEADQGLNAIVNVPHWGLSQVQIEVDPNAGGSDLRESPFGIDMSAPGTVIFRHATFSSIPHFTAGMRLRNGGMAVFFGVLGNEPTLVGPAPGDEIEFDDNVGGPYVPFVGPSATGLQTLCRYMYDGTGPP